VNLPAISRHSRIIAVCRVQVPVATRRFSDYILWPDLTETAVQGAIPTESYGNFGLEVRLPPGDVRDDTELAKAANGALTLNAAAPVGVAAKAANGDVILTGVVRDATERAAAELLVAALTGVRRVTNDIEVRADAGQP
jgi:osmotically-inducible protein OsmY